MAYMRRLFLIFLVLRVFTLSADVRIREIQSDSTGQYIGSVVTTSGIVTVQNGTFTNDPIYIQDSLGPYSGILIYSTYYTVNTGDSIRVTGTVTEYWGKTEIGYVSSLTVLASGCDLPAPTIVNTSALATSNPDTAEMYEGVLVGVMNPVVTDTTLGYGEWEIDDGSGPCRVNDEASYTMPSLNDTLAAIVGILNYSYDDFKLEPRGDFDIYRSFSGIGKVTLYPNQLLEGVPENLSIRFSTDFGQINSVRIIIPETFDFTGSHTFSGAGFLNAVLTIAGDTLSIENACVNQIFNGTLNLADVTPRVSGVETLQVFTGSQSDTALSPISDFPEILVSRSDGTIPISLLRQNNSQGIPLLLGETVNITGIMTVAGELGGQYFLEDNTAGVCVYNPGSGLSIGDSASFQGTVTQWNGLTELSPASIVSGPHPSQQPKPLTVTCSTLSLEGTGGVENFEGRLVKIDNLLRTSPVFPQTGQNMTIQDPTGTFELRIEASDIAGKPVPEDGFSITGVVSQYSPSSPYTSGYQLMPRGLFDIRKGGNGSGFAEPFLSSVPVSSTGDITIVLKAEMDTLNFASFELSDTAWHWSGTVGDVEVGQSGFVDSIAGDGVTRKFVVFVSGLSLPPDSICGIVFKNVTAPGSFGKFTLKTKTALDDPFYLQEIYDSPEVWSVMTISDAQSPDSGGYSSAHQGEFVVVAGVVTGPSSVFNGSTTKTSFWIEDASGGVNVFSSEDEGNVSFVIGTEVVVRGVVTEYNGVTEIVYSSPDSVLKIGFQRPLPDTLDLVSNQGLYETVEGRLARVSNAVVVTLPQQSGSGKDFTVRNGRTLISVRVNDDAGIDLSGLQTSQIINVCGIIGQYTYDNPPASGYQLLPRIIPDIQIADFGPVSEEQEMTVYPNPISFSLGEILNIFLNSPTGGRIALRIFDMEGRLVRTLLENTSSGPQLILWDGLTDYGNSASIGIYFINYTFKKPDGSETSINRPFVVGTPLE
ncbi:hypothetical protein JXA84_04670 [candidate division WOR-3 bacterium]|nr:hypothetical protein [candidate division WOR-3 bacterium]